ncbi:helix-turn-helix transcriptional regulator [Streptosporangium sp. NPDC051022]|uniref:helix-turn-helix domain-containing protein n=1 Tax=Streptosporangium sp. NPDC051022 TaxID=3155752 RepID=UPI00341FFE13
MADQAERRLAKLERVAEEVTSYTEVAEVAEVPASLPLLVREARRARHLSQRKAADQIGVSLAPVSRIESSEGFYIDSALSILRWLDAGKENRG